MIRACALAALLLLVAAPPTGAQSPAAPAEEVLRDPQASVRRELLVTHGINADGASLRSFLANGFTAEARKRGLPTKPPYKAEMVNAALQELAHLRDADSVPLLMEIVNGAFPTGVRRVMGMDLEQQPPEMYATTQSAIERLFVLNAIVALGIIGDAQATPAIRAAMARDSASRFTCEGAIALALLGSRDGLGPLLALASNPESPESVPAFNTIYIITGRNFGYTTQTSILKRRDLIAELSKWYDRESSTVFLDRAEILRRRQQGAPTAPQLTGDSPRALLRRSRDMAVQGNRIAAREALSRRMASYEKELRLIAMDPYEDNDIRAEAMRWFTIVKREDARSTIKRMRNDLNQPIREMAETLLREIDKLDD